MPRLLEFHYIDTSFITLFNLCLHSPWPFCRKCSRSPVTSCCQEWGVSSQSFLWSWKYLMSLTTPLHTPPNCSWLLRCYTHMVIILSLSLFLGSSLWSTSSLGTGSSPDPTTSSRPVALNTTYLLMTQFFSSSRSPYQTADLTSHSKMVELGFKPRQSKLESPCS